MNNHLRILLFGLIIWAVPFFTSFLVWDVESGAPSIGLAWFNALMAFTWMIGFSIAAILHFRNVKRDFVRIGWTTGIVWYLELVVLDLIFLVGMFGMSLVDFYPLVLTYINAIVLCGAIGYIRRG